MERYTTSTSVWKSCLRIWMSLWTRESWGQRRPQWWFSTGSLCHISAAVWNPATSLPDLSVLISPKVPGPAFSAGWCMRTWVRKRRDHCIYAAPFPPQQRFHPHAPTLAYNSAFWVHFRDLLFLLVSSWQGWRDFLLYAALQGRTTSLSREWEQMEVLDHITESQNCEMVWLGRDL